jgi:hypothetical protein
MRPLPKVLRFYYVISTEKKHLRIRAGSPNTRRWLLEIATANLDGRPPSCLLIPRAMPDVVLGRNNNFPKSDEIGPPRPMERGPWDGRVTAFIGCFKAVSMRDTLSLNNARGPSSLCTPSAPLLQDFSSAALLLFSLSLPSSFSLSLSLSLHMASHTLVGLAVDVAARVCVCATKAAT